ncbi:Gfo/Idh/MocA family oxidoreductase [Balneolales bacterium ANBcel1]|nr:Gfo/Idh/MocA family oxidoreductase [Balneolales bacterium ANBcel1]
MKKKNGMTRREYLKTSLIGSAGVFMAPAIVPSTVFGKTAPSNNIQVGQIGFGRISRVHNLPSTMRLPGVRVVAVCDVDTRRMEDGKRFIENWYAENKGSEEYIDVKMYQYYREMLEQSDIDAVIISTPDHAHFLPCIEASVAGKDIFMEKPMSLTVEEGRLMSDILHRNGTVFQLGSQQRSRDPWPHFKRACELVRNGRIGALKTVEVGLPGDPPGGNPAPMPVPATLDYDAWLGTTPKVPYTVDRVHPQEGYGRPGWLRNEQFSAGMITGWGTHHVDTAHWGMGTEHTGPLEVEAEAAFPDDDPGYEGLWNVHGEFRVEAKYAGGTTMIISGDYDNGVRFVGEDGWIFVTRGSGVTDDEPGLNDEDSPLRASDTAILRSEIGPGDIRLYESEEQHANWIRCIRTREQTVAPPEVAHRSCTACLISHIAMKLPRKLRWDPLNERFRNDDEANAMLSRPQRYPYKLSQVPGLLKK